MMLPGVELARKRRIHHHGSGGHEAAGSPRGYPPAGPSPRTEQRSGTTMGESALVARRRLEEKLRGFGRGSAAPQSPAFSWRNPAAGGTPGRAASAAVASDILSAATKGQKKPPPAAAAEPAASGPRPEAAALQRVNSAASAEACAVCLEGFRGVELGGRQVLNLPCAHRYHWDCVLPWLDAHPNCPCCRTPVVPS